MQPDIKSSSVTSFIVTISYIASPQAQYVARPKTVAQVNQWKDGNLTMKLMKVIMQDVDAVIGVL